MILVSVLQHPASNSNKVYELVQNKQGRHFYSLALSIHVKNAKVILFLGELILLLLYT
jgi:hypothetical protein